MSTQKERRLYLALVSLSFQCSLLTEKSVYIHIYNIAGYFKMPWLVVKFDLENTVEAVPTNWYCEQSSTCYWPPDSCSNPIIEEKIKNQDTPDPLLWKTYTAVILGQYGKSFLIGNI